MPGIRRQDDANRSADFEDLFPHDASSTLYVEELKRRRAEEERRAKRDKDLKDKAKQDVKGKDERIIELEKDVKTKDMKIGELEKAVNTKDTEIGQLKKDAKTKDTKIGELEKDVTTKDTVISQLKKDVTNAGIDITRLNGEVERQRKRANGLLHLTWNDMDDSWDMRRVLITHNRSERYMWSEQGHRSVHTNSNRYGFQIFKRPYESSWYIRNESRRDGNHYYYYLGIEMKEDGSNPSVVSVECVPATNVINDEKYRHPYIPDTPDLNRDTFSWHIRTSDDGIRIMPKLCAWKVLASGGGEMNYVTLADVDIENQTKLFWTIKRA